MENQINVTKAMLVAATMLAVATTLPVGAGDGNLGNPDILPPQSHAYGKTYAEWAAAWWQWGLTLPLAGHPFYGCPADCDAGQSGKVWFVAGGPTDCSCTVPEGKAVFFPLVNAECSSLEDPPFHGNTAAEQRECAKYWADHIVVASLFCEIDDVPARNLPSYRVVSPQISFTAPTPWAYGNVGGPGTSVGDGYYVLLHPLSKGVHTIHFGGVSHFDAGELGPDPVDFGVDTTYHLIVTPEHGEHGDH
jgi:hypothetical protein